MPTILTSSASRCLVLLVILTTLGCVAPLQKCLDDVVKDVARNAYNAEHASEIAGHLTLQCSGGAQTQIQTAWDSEKLIWIQIQAQRRSGGEQAQTQRRFNVHPEVQQQVQNMEWQQNNQKSQQAAQQCCDCLKTRKAEEICASCAQQVQCPGNSNNGFLPQTGMDISK